VISRRPIKPEIQKKINVLPEHLYKVCGEVQGGLKFEIEITPTQEQPDSDSYGSMLKTTSAGQLFDICGANDDASLMKFPIGSNKGWQCIVAFVEALEATKCSHIHGSTYFPKHIGGTHTLRSVMPSSSSQVNIGLYADKDKPWKGSFSLVCQVTL
jgi:hypothetical protein